MPEPPLLQIFSLDEMITAPQLLTNYDLDTGQKIIPKGTNSYQADIWLALCLNYDL